jgi:two-component system NarL family response regulator
MEKIKVILSHPQVIFREGIHFVLSGEEDFEVAGETTGNREAFELIEANPPDIAILSQNDDKVSVAEMTRRIKRNFPSVSVILIPDKNDSEQIFTSLTSGVSAYLTPDTEPERLVAVIRDVAQGRLPVVEALLTPALAARTLADFQDLATLNERMGITMAQLSRKEAEILNCIVSGSGIGQVVAKLNLTEEVIRGHLRVILQKLVANDRARAVISEAQRTLPSLIPGVFKGKGEPSEYLTKAEFSEFKDSLMAGFKSLVSGKP